MRTASLVSLVILFLSPLTASAFCYEEAGNIYGISPALLEAISWAESGHDNSAINWNRDGSYDYCHMQVNSGWYARIGREKWMSIADPCECTKVAAGILRGCIDKYGYTWQAVGCYNASGKGKRVRYAWKIYNALRTPSAYHRHGGKQQEYIRVSSSTKKPGFIKLPQM